MQANPPQIMAGVAVQPPHSGSDHEIATARLEQLLTLAGGGGREEDRPFPKK
jgi:hypothetical protein